MKQLTFAIHEKYQTIAKYFEGDKGKTNRIDSEDLLQVMDFKRVQNINGVMIVSYCLPADKANLAERIEEEWNKWYKAIYKKRTSVNVSNQDDDESKIDYDEFSK